MVGQVIENIVDPDMGCRIHKRASTTLNLGVFSLSVLVELNLLHVCLPIDLCVWKMTSAKIVLLHRCDEYSQGTFLMITTQNRASRTSRRSGTTRDRTCWPVATFCTSLRPCNGRDSSWLVIVLLLAFCVVVRLERKLKVVELLDSGSTCQIPDEPCRGCLSCMDRGWGQNPLSQPPPISHLPDILIFRV